MTFIFIVFIVLLDQLTKMMAVKYLKNKEPYIIINNFFDFTYVENRGAAFGILKHKRILFIVITLVVILVLTVYVIKYFKSLNKLTVFAISLLIAGAAGNLIDRIRFGYVVDFISFRLFNKYDFPVFNIADICIVLSTGIIILLVMFDKFDT